MKRILLASLKAGGGHHALRDSFHHVLKTVDPAEERFVPTVWDSSDRMVNWFYSVTVHHMPTLQGGIVNLSAQNWVVDVVSRTSPKLFREAQDVLRENRYDAVISTHFLMSMMFAKAKHALGVSTPIVAAIPDYGIPTVAFRPTQRMLRADHTIVMGEDTYEHFRGERVPTSQLHLSGFVTKEAFVRTGRAVAGMASRADKVAYARTVEEMLPELRGLDFNRPTLVFLGGSAWTAKTEPVIDRILDDAALASQLNLIVVCGKDEDFANVMRSRAVGVPNLRVFGFVKPDALARLMALGDASVLGSLAPATMQELLEVGAGPLLLHHFIPGTERPHVSYIEREKIGLYEPNAEKMVKLIAQVTGLCEPSAEVKALTQGFHRRARAIRETSLERAYQLPDFLEQYVVAREHYYPRPSAESFALA